MLQEVFKFQRALFSIGVDAHKRMALVYNQDRSKIGEFEASEELHRFFDAYGEKFFAVGIYNPSSEDMCITRVLSEDAWPNW